MGIADVPAACGAAGGIVAGAADLDGDGMGDLLLSTRGMTPRPDGRLDVLRNLGGGRFAAPEPLATTIDLLVSATGDFNGDGRLDVVVATWAGALLLVRLVLI